MNITLIQIPEDNSYVAIFKKGDICRTMSGRTVEIIADNFKDVSKGSHSCCVRGSDGYWRYAHSGRCTGSPVGSASSFMRLTVNSVPAKNKIDNIYRRFKFFFSHISYKLEFADITFYDCLSRIKRSIKGILRN
jgi:hypothetical protein